MSMPIEDSLLPSRITDIIENAEMYINHMREKEDKEEIPKFLNDYRWKFFRKVDLNKEQLRALALFIVDNLYRFTAKVALVDDYTRLFIATTMPQLLDDIQSRAVDIFYILDNEMQDDRFKMTIQIFELAGMAVVTPNLENLKYDVVEKKIKDHMAKTRNIVYIERDASVDYLKKVIDLTRCSKDIVPDSNYFGIFRNRGPETSDVEIIFE